MITTCVTFPALLAYITFCIDGGFCQGGLYNGESLHATNVTGQGGSGICVTLQPSSADLSHLCQQEVCDTLHCVFRSKNNVNGSSTDRSKNNVRRSSTVCFSEVCSRFSITLLTDTQTHVSQDASLKVLGNIINEHVIENSDIEEVNSILKVECADKSSHLLGKQLKIELGDLSKEVIRSENSQVQKVTNIDEADESDHQQFNVHVIYFRFLSRWESFIKLPRSHASIKILKQSSDWSVYTTQSYQSSSLLLEHNFKFLLGELDEETSHENLTQKTSLISEAIRNGRCFLFRSLGCHQSPVYTNIVHLTRSRQNVENCAGQVTRYDIDTEINVTSCEQINALFGKEDNSLLQNVLSRSFSTNGSGSQNIFSFTIVNVPDVHSSYDLDKELASFLSSLMEPQHQSHSVILMSDVGDPKFARLDLSTFLRVQTFNPFLYILTPRRLNISFPLTDTQVHNERLNISFTLTDTQVHNERLNISFTLTDTQVHNESENKSNPPEFIVAVDIYHLLKNWLVSNTSIDTIEKNYTAVTKDKMADLSTLESIIIRGPVECICEGSSVRFHNDSIQAAFASYFVGHLHNYLLDVSSGRRDIHCDRLIGVYFDNVYHILLENETDIKMTITFASVQHVKNTRRMFRINTHLQYTTEKFMQFTLLFSLPGKKREYPMKSLETRKFMTNICKPISDVEHENLLSKIQNNSPMNFGHFGVEATVKPIHSSCLFLVTTRFPDSTVLEVDNRCDDIGYQLTVSAELIDTLSLVPLPVKMNVGPRKTRYISSLVKAYYGAPWAAYKLSFKVAPDVGRRLAE